MIVSNMFARHRILILIASMALALASPPAYSAGKRIYIAPDDHTDYLWSADEEAYRQAFIEMIDYYLDLAEETARHPAATQSRWNCDGSLWLWTYERNKTPAEFERLIRNIRNGNVSAPLNALVSCYGGQPAEAVLRGMYYAGSLERRYGFRFPLAIAMENQTLPGGLGALWAGAGAEYSWKGICGCATRMPRNQRRPHEVYWWKAPDGSRILMKWYTLLGKNQSVGGYAEARNPAAAVEFVDQDPQFTSIHPYSVIGIFGKGWDDLKTLTREFVDVASSKTTAARKVIVSNQTDYFEDMLATHGHELPELSAAYGNEWDLYSASLSEVSATVRRSVERLRAAESLASLVSLQRPEFLDRRSESRNRAWMNLGLYWEHNWTADGPVIKRSAREAWQRRIAAEIHGYVDRLHRDATYALGDLIENSGRHPRFFVFNPLSWRRSGVADIEWPRDGEFHVVDLTTGQEAPSQTVRKPSRVYSKGMAALRIWAGDIPPFGYKVFEVRPGTGRTWPRTVAAEDGWIENEHLRVRVAERGAITSWIDKRHGNRELIQTVDGRAANDLGPGGGELTVENAGPVSVSIRAESAQPLAHTTRVTVYRNSPRIDIDNEINENFGEVRDWAFSFNIDNPLVRHEEVGAILRAARQSSGGDYSNTNARLDWLTLNHFADIGAGAGVTLSNADCAFMRLGRSKIENETTFLDTATPRISVLAGGQVDGPRLGIQAQGGDSYFLQRFALQSRDTYDAAGAMRFALEHQNPLVTGAVRGGKAYPETRYSLLSIDEANVLAWALKPAEDGIRDGLIVRVWNLSPDDSRVTLQLAGGIARAVHTTHIETETGPATVKEGKLLSPINGWQIRSFRVQPATLAQ